MSRVTVVTSVIAAAVLAGAPCRADSGVSETATASYNPWVAAGLTCSALPIGAAAIGPGLFYTPHQPGLSIVGAPLLSVGHFYVGEPMRGLAFTSGGAAAYLASAAAYVWLWGGRSFPYSPEPRWQEGAADKVGLGYFALSAALTTWAAWDAYLIAEEKNRGTR